MSVRNTLTTCGCGQEDPAMFLFTSASVNALVDITLHAPWRPEDEFMLILLGKEQITLEFYDVESLERLRDIADEGARRLQAMIEANTLAHRGGPP